ncbi:S-4TM family putative pore-forming effector [Sphingobacterium faecium]|uniref:S-4TM family putative pore-forming effector n=1 Tax=Sphingobacterium faecium TaxID=34087 RepID=UPI003209F28A
MDSTIFTRQNEARNIAKLAAQKQIYISAKRIFMIQLIITVPCIVILTILKLLLSLFLNIDITEWIIICAISITLIDLLLLNPLIAERRKNAAKVQESFDCSVYDINWNKIFANSKPSNDLIYKFEREFKKSGKDFNKLYDWYPVELASMPHNRAIVLCQKTNLSYDSALRKKFINLVLITAFSTLLLLFIFGLLQNYTLKSFLIQLCASFLPIIYLAIKITKEQNKTLKSSDELQGAIDAVLEKDVIDSNDIRQIQDRIFCHRKDSALVPEFFYSKKRNGLETEMHDIASAYQQNQGK